MERRDILGLLPYCTNKEQERNIKALTEHGSNTKVAKALGLNRRTVDKSIASVRRNAENHGYSPESLQSNGVSPNHAWKGTSTLIDFRERPEGEKLLQWVKSQPEQEKLQEAMREAVEAMKAEIPRVNKTKKPKKTNPHLLNQYTITDFHIGALAWDEEAGENWDTDIASELLCNWFSRAIEIAPDAKIGVFAELGDFEHFDSLEAVTPASGHILDADTRLPKLIRKSITINRFAIEQLLKKHDEVYVLIAEGNHNPASSVWRRELFQALYEKEPRVKVVNSADVYHCIEHGLVSLFYHHGHKRKPKNIDDVFAAKFRDVFGRTKFSYAHMGHCHHDVVVESNLMTIEQHRTLAAKDAYASRGGWMAGRSAKVITYDDRYGEVGRITLTPEMVESCTE
jgi:hypothetical protein